MAKTATATKNPAAVALGRLGGLAGRGVSTPARRRASRKNGKLGGRPKKIMEKVGKDAA